MHSEGMLELVLALNARPETERRGTRDFVTYQEALSPYNFNFGHRYYVPAIEGPISIFLYLFIFSR